MTHENDALHQFMSAMESGDECELENAYQAAKQASIEAQPMEPRTEHTPTPWVAAENHRHPRTYIVILGVGDETVAVIDTFGDEESPRDANAEFIVRACNSHDALLETCRRLRDAYLDTSGNGYEWTAREGGKAAQMAIIAIPAAEAPPCQP